MTPSTHAWTDETATIGVAGIDGPLRVLHVTDSHVSVPHEEADRPFAHYGERMDRLFADYPTLDTFRAQMERARAERHDLIALTGDHVNYPSPTAVAAVHRLLESAGRRSMFTAGNHDWSYAGMPGSPDDRRREWRERSLLPLYRGRAPHADSLDLGGVRFVAIDNSTRQIDPEQLAFFTDRLDGGLPVVLLVHCRFGCRATTTRTTRRRHRRGRRFRSAATRTPARRTTSTGASPAGSAPARPATCRAPKSSSTGCWPPAT